MMKQEFNITPGTVISGKWHGETYRVITLLGKGANGTVYLAEGRRGLSALKISSNSMSITSEVNVLKHFSKVRGSSLGPSLFDTDDWVPRQGVKAIPFYAMEYIRGELFLDFLQKKGQEWTIVLAIQLLFSLETLHKAGWIFGDLKPENLIVTDKPTKIRCIDVGGTTQAGRAVKEFTEFFDRGYWGLGDRKAEPSYDLFAVAMVVINAAYPRRFTKKEGTGGKEQLYEAIRQNSFLKQYKVVLSKAIMGKYISAEEMRLDFIAASQLHQSNTEPASEKMSKHPGRQKTRKRKRRSVLLGLVETAIIVIGIFILYSLYVYHYLL
ncbi:protein kinase family protein [Bacillus lacus]|uniref:Protein kinase family protein n=1 Tax=Metabacillus lacus TaxID=1983721 RepID=A0A7X2J095_9BACI|nr:serine/threonine-protein kinase [Metabacillus lacus]MRX72970.1 protein kinase family protein [Metabacillus lacus]